MANKKLTKSQIFTHAFGFGTLWFHSFVRSVIIETLKHQRVTSVLTKDLHTKKFMIWLTHFG